MLAVPGDVDRAKAAGCNTLIRDGATLVRDADDVLAAIGAVRREEGAGPAAARADGVLDALPYARRALDALAEDGSDVETLAARLDAPIGVLLGTLLRLELLGAVARDGARYALVRGRC